MEVALKKAEDQRMADRIENENVICQNRKQAMMLVLAGDNVEKPSKFECFKAGEDMDDYIFKLRNSSSDKSARGSITWNAPLCKSYFALRPLCSFPPLIEALKNCESREEIKSKVDELNDPKGAITELVSTCKSAATSLTSVITAAIKDMEDESKKPANRGVGTAGPVTVGQSQVDRRTTARLAANS